MKAAPVDAVRGQVQENVSMAKYSSWKAGGSAAMLFMPEDVEDLAVFLRTVPADLDIYFIGLGSNLLVRDGGVDGVVIRLAPGLTGLEFLGDGRIHAEAGVAMPKLARFAAANDCGQAGFMAGIPGTVGGALAMNAGCFGHSTWEYVEKVQLVSRASDLIEKEAAEFSVGYRTVAHPEHSPAWFLAAVFKFPAAATGETAQDKEMMAERNMKQPIGTANAGSVFVNPYGMAAGKLVEEAGLAGVRVGEAEVSDKHCNFIINRGKARADDIEKLIELVRGKVQSHSGVDLHLEVRIIGKKA